MSKFCSEIGVSIGDVTIGDVTYVKETRKERISYIFNSKQTSNQVVMHTQERYNNIKNKNLLGDLKAWYENMVGAVVSKDWGYLFIDDNQLKTFSMIITYRC